ncbi:MAG: M18 family aminopeptidase [Microthrixaceae bacterium]
MESALDVAVPAHQRLVEFISLSPTPFHAVVNAARRLTAVGFEEVVDAPGLESPTAIPLPVRRSAPALPDRGYLRRGGALLAWSSPSLHAARRDRSAVALPWRIIGAHTDSPNLRLKPRAQRSWAGVTRLAAEPYGGVLLNSWLNRDLGLAGRVQVRTTGPVRSSGTASSRVPRTATRLFRVDQPTLVVPQLAIHLDRGVNERGLVLDPQQHLNPVWRLGSDIADPECFVEWLASQVDVAPRDVVGYDVMCHDVAAPALIGADMLASARLDNLCCSFGAVETLLAAPQDARYGVIVALFDHEEVGSESATGAASVLLSSLLDRLWDAAGANTEDRARSLAGSRMLSADMAHGVHPNFPDRHEPGHLPLLGGGLVIKHNVNGRYATEAVGSGELVAACQDADVPTQTFVNRADLVCGSTIGPTSAARLGVHTTDVGLASWSMHSIREVMAVADVDHMLRGFRCWLDS